MDVKDYDKIMLRLGTLHAGSVVRQRRLLNAPWQKRINGTLKLFSARPYINSKLKTKTGIADLDIETGKATTDSEKAEALNKFFSDHVRFTDDDTSNIPSFHTEEIRKPLAELKITEE